MKSRFEFKKYIREDENKEEYTELHIVDNNGLLNTLVLQEEFAGLLLTTLFQYGIDAFMDLLRLEELISDDEEEKI